MRTDYDIKTAITFLMIGLGAGTILSLLLSAKQLSEPISPRQREERHAPGFSRMSA